MILEQSDKEFLQNFAKDNHLKLTKDYSGRCMYGKTCVGFVGRLNDFELGVNLGKEFGANGGLELLEDAISQESRTDSMGMDSIIYFPKVQWVDEEEEEEEEEIE